jgi:outer membrane protein assembly factor BamB
VDSAAGENWTSYRGPTDQGHCHPANLPIRWSEQENVVWKTPIPGKAWSSPVIWGKRIWLTSATEDGTQLMVLCVDKDSGKVILRKRLRTVVAPQYCHPFNSYASPSPVIEEGRVYVSFGSPYNACLDSVSGEVIWERTDFVCYHFRGPGASPFLYKNLLLLHFDGSDFQYVVAMDKQTGQTVWRTDRSVDYQDLDPQTGKPALEGDYRKAFSTPVTAEVDGTPMLISLGSKALYGYEPDTGKELWQVGAPGSHSGACRPVTGHGLVFSPMGSGTPLLIAVRPNGRGDVTESHVVWRYTRVVPRRASLLLIDDLLFMVDDDGVAACVEAKTGEEAWRARLGGNYSSSPIYTRGRVYFFDQDGKSTVIEAAPEFKVIAVNRLDEGFMASPAVSGDELYLRTKTDLYRIEDESRNRGEG